MIYGSGVFLLFVYFFIALIEHKSSVDYNVSMQILRYMVYIWDDYERREEKRVPGIIASYDFE